MAKDNTGRHAFLVAAGILISRIAGLVRQRVFSNYFGLSDEADAFYAAFKVPNFLQNLFGDGVLSASFIPVYSRLLARQDEEEAGRVAGAIGAILGLVTSLIVLAGVVLTPYLIWLIAPGFPEAKRELTIRLVRILFPGAGLLVFSAWSLGILNSHRRFFLSYTAPVIWNATMIATMWKFAGRDLSALAIYLAWGSVLGSALQFAVQMPTVLGLMKHLRLHWDTASANVREVMRNFAPVFVSRGVVQISAYVDQMIASWLSKGAVAALTNAQSIYTLPVSLFGMAVSAAELPAMSSALGTEAEIHARLRQRLNAGLRQIAFFIVPSAMAFFALGDVIAAALYESGKFTHADSLYVWRIIAGSAIGLLASTLGRLYASTYYALRDTRTPLRFAMVRVALTIGLGYLCAIPLGWGAPGLTGSAGVSGWVEFVLLRRSLNRRIGSTGLPVSFTFKLWTAAAAGAAVAWLIKPVVAGHARTLQAIPILGAYGLVYFAATYLMRVEELAGLTRRFRRS